MDKAKTGDHVRVQYSAPAKRGGAGRRPGKTVLEFTVAYLGDVGVFFDRVTVVPR